MEAEKKQLEDRLAKLKSGSIKPIDPANRDRINKNYKRVSKQASNRKKIRKELWETVLDMCGDSKEMVEKTKEDLCVEEWNW